MSPQKSLHATAVNLIAEALRVGFGRGFFIRGQMPLTLDNDSEPDVAVVKGNIRDYADHHPSSAILIVEASKPPLMPVTPSPNTGPESAQPLSGGLPQAEPRHLR